MVAGIHRRLLLGHQPRLADLRVRAQLQRRLPHRLSETNHRAGTQRRWLARARPHGDYVVGYGRPGRTRQRRAGAARRARGWPAMSSILALARPEIVALKAYSHASWDPAFDRLHANELPWRAETDRSLAGLNRYPEPHPHELAQRLA